MPVKARWTNIVTLLTAPAVLGAVAPYCANWHWTIDLLACFPVQSCHWLLVGGATLALGRKWLPASIFATFSVIAAIAIMPGWFAQNNFPDIGESGSRIRVLSLNLLHSNDKGHATVLKVVRELKPDVIWCAEYTSDWQRFFRRELQDFPHRSELARNGSFGAALLSRHPLVLAEMIELGHSWAPACRAVVQLPSGPIGFLGVHAPPPGLSSRRSQERDRGLAAIPLALENLPERRIVCGDFNATPWNASFQKLRADTGLSPGTTTWWLPTWPSSLPAPLRIPIDHVLVAGKLSVEEAQLGAHFHSDHLPLFAVVRIVE